MTWTPPSSGTEPTGAVAQDRDDADSQRAPSVDLVTALDRVSVITPERIVTRHRRRVLCYRELSEVVGLLLPVTRSQHMADESAVVAAIFARLPELSAESDHEIVASVISGALGRIWTDHADVTGMSDSRGVDESPDVGQGDIRTSYAV